MKKDEIIRFANENPICYMATIEHGVITSYSIHYTKLYESPFCMGMVETIELPI